MPDALLRANMGDPDPFGLTVPDWHFEAIRRYWSGESVLRIAEALGHTWRSVRSALERAGGDLPTRDALRKSVEFAVEDGWPQSEICETWGIDPSTLRKWFPDVDWMKRRVWQRGSLGRLK